jgi:conjugal transfer pilus assembly protein TraF
MRFRVVLSSVILGALTNEGVFFECHAEELSANGETRGKGWNWYKEPPAPKEKKTAQPTPPEKQTAPSSATERMVSYRKRFNEALNEAVLNPTLENVKMARAAQREMMEKATQFEEMFMLVDLLDPQRIRPGDQTNLLFRKNFEAEQERALDAALKKLSRTHGLFFLFKKSCPYCKDFAPIVAEFAKTYGFDLLGVSGDGGYLPGIRQLPDNGMIAKLNPKGFFPGLLLVPYEGNSPPLPLAWGLTSIADLKQNTKFILQAMGSQNKEWQ